MGANERLTLPIPYGRHVYVVSDLALSPTTDESSRPVRELVDLLGNIDDPAVVVVAGNLLHPDPTSDLSKFIDATLSALPTLTSAIEEFTGTESHQLIVLPGNDDHELSHALAPQAKLEALGITLARDLLLQVTTLDGTHDLVVAAGTSTVDRSRADASDQDDADRLEDPTALPRFVASRVLYRRLSGWVWFPVLAMAVFDLSNTFTRILNHFTHRHLHVHTLHTGSFWKNVLLNLLLIAATEAVVVVAAGLIVRQRFDREARKASAPTLSEPLSLTRVNGVDATEFARLVAERWWRWCGRRWRAASGPRLPRSVRVRGAGTFANGHRRAPWSPRASPRLHFRGATRHRGDRSREHHPGATHCRSVVTTSRHVVGTFDRRSRAAAFAQREDQDHWFVAQRQYVPGLLSRLQEQRRQRTVRRWAAGLIFFVGLINVGVSVSIPLHSRLHHVLQLLPLGVAQSADAVTAVAGMGMIMMARGLRRGQRRAWFIVVVILSITIVAHVARAGTVFASLLAAVLLGLLITQRQYFQGTSDRSSVRSALPRLGLIAVVTVFVAAIGIEFSPARHQLPNFGVVLVACIERLFAQYDINLPDGVDGLHQSRRSPPSVSRSLSARCTSSPVRSSTDGCPKRDRAPSDDWPNYERARSCAATDAARSTTSRYVTTNSSSSFATRWWPTPSTAASRCCRPTRSDPRANAAKSSAPFAPTPKPTAGPSASWPPVRSGCRSITRRDCTISISVTRPSSTVPPSRSRAAR